MLNATISSTEYQQQQRRRRRQEHTRSGGPIVACDARGTAAFALSCNFVVHTRSRVRVSVSLSILLRFLSSSLSLRHLQSRLRDVSPESKSTADTISFTAIAGNAKTKVGLSATRGERRDAGVKELFFGQIPSAPPRRSLNNRISARDETKVSDAPTAYRKKIKAVLTKN